MSGDIIGNKFQWTRYIKENAALIAALIGAIAVIIAAIITASWNNPSKATTIIVNNPITSPIDYVKMPTSEYWILIPTCIILIFIFIFLGILKTKKEE